MKKHFYELAEFQGQGYLNETKQKEKFQNKQVH